MAADQRITSGNAPCRTHKIRRIGDSLYAGCGNWSLVLVFFDWFEKPKRDLIRLHRLIPEDCRCEFEILELSPKGLARWDGWGMRTPILDKFYGVGSGGSIAMQAIKRGCSPEEAVAETLSLDECSGGSVDVEFLLPPELRPVTRKRR
jgi:hypothetical protein